MDTRREMMGGVLSSSKLIDNYLTIEALEDGLTASLSTNTCEYCVDFDDNWKTLAAGTATESINTGHTLSFRGNLTPNSTDGIGTFTISKKCNLKGNCMSMLFGDNAANNFSLSGKNYAFCNLFNNCNTIVNVSDNFLPATTLANDCYNYMFIGCTSLITAPALPAKTLADGCYWGMFYKCTSLTTAPELPATTLATSCYQAMFIYCSSLTTASALPATTLANKCYRNMFYGCSSLTTAPALPAMVMMEECYWAMFKECISLKTPPALPATTLARSCYIDMFAFSGVTTAPALPATTLAGHCYSCMFEHCTSLTAAPELPATHSIVGTDSWYYGMFRDCSSLNTAPSILPMETLSKDCYLQMFMYTSLTTAPELPATTLADSCYWGMFQNCSSLTTAPTLPATELVTYCYKMMFSDCSKLNYIKMLATDISASSCLDYWVDGVASTGTFVKNKNATWNVTGESGIPDGWTVQNA